MLVSDTYNSINSLHRPANSVPNLPLISSLSSPRREFNNSNCLFLQIAYISKISEFFVKEFTLA